MKTLFTSLELIEGKITYTVNGKTYPVREELKKLGFEWIPWNEQWEMVLTGTRKEIVAQVKKLNDELKTLNVPVDFSAKRSNIALDKFFEINK